MSSGETLKRLREAKKRPSKKASKGSIQATGDCYEAAGRYVVDHAIMGKERHLLLVHGEVEQQVEPWLRYGHAWVEDGETVIDVSNGRDIRMPKMLYYAFGKVYPNYPPFKPNLHVYTVEEMRKKILQYEHWGPWDLKTSSGY